MMFIVRYSLATSNCLSAGPVATRAVFDIGSGRIKVQVADVDTAIGSIVSVKYFNSYPVALREDLGRAPGCRLSNEVQDRAIETILKLMRETAPFSPHTFAAIATEALRLAENSQELLARIKREAKLSVVVISRNEEGVLGFVSVLEHAKIAKENAICWDFGGGSFQVTALCSGDYMVYEGKIGNVAVKEIALQVQQRQGSPNPVSAYQAQEIIAIIKEKLGTIPQKLLKKIEHSGSTVLGIGVNPFYDVDKRESYSIEDVKETVKAHLELDDRALIAKNKVLQDRCGRVDFLVLNLLFTEAFMELFEIKKITVIAGLGINTTGVFLSKKYWQKM